MSAGVKVSFSNSTSNKLAKGMQNNCDCVSRLLQGIGIAAILECENSRQVLLRRRLTYGVENNAAHQTLDCAWVLELANQQFVWRGLAQIEEPTDDGQRYLPFFIGQRHTK
jgi:hypothetical protein